MRRHRSVNLQPSLHTVDNYRPCARTYVPLVSRHTRLPPPVVGPYRLIDGDSRVGNPIHWAEDKFHVPQCVSKRGGGTDDLEGGGARSTAVTSGNYGGFVYARIYVAPYLLPSLPPSPSRRLEPCTLG